MEVLVARKAEQRHVIVVRIGHARRRQGITPAQEARARPMLETAVSVGHCVDEEQIAVERRRAAEQIDMFLANQP